MPRLICFAGVACAVLAGSCRPSEAPVATTNPETATQAAAELTEDGAIDSPPADRSPVDTSQGDAVPAGTSADDSAVLSSAAVFERRILPILRSPRPSSCTECHLSGVDLKDYLRESQAETFAALVAAGLINRADPEASKILEFIRRSPASSSLISQKVRQQELAGFQEWITAAVNDQELAGAKATGPIGPQLPAEVIRHARTDRVLSSFLENVWSEVARCAACHSPDRNEKQVREHGARVSWIQLNDPAGTLQRLRDASLIDLDAPGESLLLKKPLMQVKHGGGQKMVVGDRTYQQFRRFLDDYAAIEAGSYRTAADLPVPPEEVSAVSEIWLKITNVPARFDKQLLQVDLYRWTGSGWSAARVATSDRPVFGPMQLWQHSLSLMAQRGSAEARDLKSLRLPPGRYRVRISVDQQNRLGKDPRSQLGPEDVVGEVEVESQWPAGYGQMTSVRYPD